jgi:hypothetical protein
MPKNMGLIDKTIRFTLAAVIIVLFITGMISGIAAIILGIFAVVFVVTSFLGTCPLYLPFKFSTIKKQVKEE